MGENCCRIIPSIIYTLIQHFIKPFKQWTCCIKLPFSTYLLIEMTAKFKDLGTASGSGTRVSTVYSFCLCTTPSLMMWAAHGYKLQLLMTFINSYKFNSCLILLLFKARKMKSSHFLSTTLSFCEVPRVELTERFEGIESFIYTVKSLGFHQWPAQCEHVNAPWSI